MGVPFVEPVWVPDTVVNRIAYMHECCPGVWRVAFYADQVSPFDQTIERVISLKMVIGRDDMIHCIGTAIGTVGIPSLRLLGLH